MKVFLGSDHAGFELKNEIKKYLKEKTIENHDLGCRSTDSCDYPDFALKVAKEVVGNGGSIGILICGTGIGMCMAANKVKGVRAALCTNEYMARMAREHNDANVLCLGARVLGKDAALKIVETFINTPFSGEEKHKKRIKKIMEVERES